MNAIRLLTLATTCSVLAAAEPVSAQATCESFEVTTVVTLAFAGDPNDPSDLTFGISGSGDGSVGPVEQEGLVRFKFVGHAVHFLSLTTITTLDGEIYTAEAGNATEQGSVGSFRILGGNGLWEGASGNGQFRVDLNPDGSQTANYQGVICR